MIFGWGDDWLILTNIWSNIVRWAKPINRRSPHERSAHIILSVSSPEAANRLIANGIIICRKKCYVKKIKKEPTRCLKCQGWNHMARDCTEPEDTCSNYMKAYRTTTCPHPHSKWCVSCKTGKHASWSRECPAFLKRTHEFKKRNLENKLPFFPPDTNNNATNFSKSRDHSNRITMNSHQRKGKAKEVTMNKQYDSYVPNYPR